MIICLSQLVATIIVFNILNHLHQAIETVFTETRLVSFVSGVVNYVVVVVD